jgi:hypothetical protein
MTLTSEKCISITIADNDVLETCDSFNKKDETTTMAVIVVTVELMHRTDFVNSLRHC